MIAYKLVDQDYYTRRNETGETHWQVGSTVSPTGIGGSPCGPGVLHFYSHPLVAALMNSAHANLKNPRLLEIETPDGAWNTDGCKRWTREPVRVLREIEMPTLTEGQRVEVAIRCSLLLPQAGAYQAWAERWLSGEDRSRTAAAVAGVQAEVARAEARRTSARVAWWASAAAEESASASAWASMASAARAAARAALAVRESAEFERQLIAMLERVTASQSSD